MMFVHGALVDPQAMAHLCNTCAVAREAPATSLAGGFDLGNPEALGIPALTALERLLVSEVRTYAVVVKVTRAGMSRPGT